MWLAALLALAMLAAACTDDGSLADNGIIADGQSTDDSVDAGNDGDADGDAVASSTPTTDTTSETTSETTGGTDGGGDGSETSVEPVPGMCAIDEVNRQTFYAVDNIPADDADGGLNLRDSYEGGEVLLTLPEGSVVAVADCYRTDDGGVWFAVDTSDVSGWVNSAFLSDEIPALTPTYGGRETEDRVEALLDALAAGQWDEAAAEFTLADSDLPSDFVAPRAQLSEDDTLDLAAALELYCATRICDAPYTVTEVRGSYVPERVSPEVDVAFTYSGGIVTETFKRISIGDEFVIDSVPGRSVLSMASSLSPTAELVDTVKAADESLYEAAEQVRLALLSEDGPRIPAGYVPAEGVAVSPDAYVDPDAGERVVVSSADLAAAAETMRIWGYHDGIGSPIVDSVDGFMSNYRRSLALLEPDVVGIDRRVGVGNTIDNLAEAFPDARIVEFHRRGRGEARDFNWSSVRLALELRNGEWQLVGITSDTWTI